MTQPTDEQVWDSFSVWQEEMDRWQVLETHHGWQPIRYNLTTDQPIVEATYTRVEMYLRTKELAVEYTQWCAIKAVLESLK